MARKRFKAEQIICLLQQAEVMIGQGMSMEAVLREIGVTGNTYYRWRKEYGGLGVDQARRLKELEQENSRLKRVVADLSLDILSCKRPPRESSDQPVTAAGSCDFRTAKTGCDRAKSLQGSGAKPRIATAKAGAQL